MRIAAAGNERMEIGITTTADRHVISSRRQAFDQRGLGAPSRSILLRYLAKTHGVIKIAKVSRVTVVKTQDSGKVVVLPVQLEIDAGSCRQGETIPINIGSVGAPTSDGSQHLHSARRVGQRLGLVQSIVGFYFDNRRQ